MKTTQQRITRQIMRQGQVERKAQARLLDLKKLKRAVWLGSHPVIAFFAAWFGLRKFVWENRYDPRYVLNWARREGWRPGRMSIAIDMVDKAIRVRENRVQRYKDAISRRAKAIVKFNRRQQRLQRGEG